MIENQPKPDWAPLPRPDCVNVEFRVLLHKDELTVANLRFGNNATIDPHDAPFDIDVVCVDGSGFTSVGNETFEISRGETIRWPKWEQHCLWTENSTLETIMIERNGA